MNNLYVKTILYAYPSLYSVTKQIDDIIEKKALASLSDFSPCVSQCERILVLSYQKDLLLWLRLKVKKVLAQLSEKEIDLLDYKYFRKRSKEYYRDFDFVSRNYFRRQIKLIKKIAKKFENDEVDDNFFENKLFEISFIKYIYKRVVDHQKKYRETIENVA